MMDNNDIVRLSLDDLQFMTLANGHEPVEENPYLDIALMIAANAHIGLLFRHNELQGPALEMAEIIRLSAEGVPSQIDLPLHIFTELVEAKPLLAAAIAEQDEHLTLDAAVFYQGIVAAARKYGIAPYDDQAYTDENDERVAQILSLFEDRKKPTLNAAFSHADLFNELMVGDDGDAGPFEELEKLMQGMMTDERALKPE